ncbi:MAG: XkdX family protein [Peptostreptococcaceae bacterium]|nr:XkdX family protein [Peptostreptococcaceae bacterium]
MEFLKLCWENEWITFEDLKLLVKTKKQPWGDITEAEFKEITGQEYTE